jgi:mono/diheme cytochrome c family protein
VIWRIGAVIATMIVVGVSCGPGSATPESLRSGRSVYAGNCSTCHGNRGQGGVGPSLSGVRDTWPSCADHQEWIALGSEGWKTEHGLVYGANDTPITKVMPGHAQTLKPAEIAAVAAFERVEYGGGDPTLELTACGIGDE